MEANFLKKADIFLLYKQKQTAIIDFSIHL